MSTKTRISHFRILACMALLAALLLAGCGGDSRTPAPAPDPGSTPPAEAPDDVAEGPAKVEAIRAGVSPFIAFVDLEVPDLARVKAARFRIAPKPGTVSAPVDITYARSYLERRGFSDGDQRLSLPIVGLYAGHANPVEIELQHVDGSIELVDTTVETAPYVDPRGIYDRAQVLAARATGWSLGFDFIFLKASYGSPIVVDTDGNLRWAVPGVLYAQSSEFTRGAFIIGNGNTTSYLRVELDGVVEQHALAGPGTADLTNYHHNIMPGKRGLLAMMDGVQDGTAVLESILIEIDPDSGTVLQRWDLGESVARHMRANGEDPAQFVRLGVDWFHMNSAVYDPSDDSLIVSGREAFVAKIDYTTGDLAWLLGDPTKYWHQFPSLAALNLDLAPGGLWPVGQHSLSLTPQGTLMLFNNGQASNTQPAGAPAGEQRSYSAVSAYAIDPVARTAAEVRRFVHPESILSSYCSSVQQTTADGGLLVTYSLAGNGTQLRLTGVGGDGSIALDLALPSAECDTAWNAEPIGLDGLRIE